MHFELQGGAEAEQVEGPGPTEETGNRDGGDGGRDGRDHRSRSRSRSRGRDRGRGSNRDGRDGRDLVPGNKNTTRCETQVHRVCSAYTQRPAKGGDHERWVYCRVTVTHKREIYQFISSEDNDLHSVRAPVDLYPKSSPSIPSRVWSAIERRPIRCVDRR